MRAASNGGSGCQQYIVRLLDGRVRYYGEGSLQPLS